MIVETLLGIAIAAAVIGTVLLTRAILPKSFPVPDVERLTVLRCTGEAEGLEGALRSERGETYILDAGMTAQARRRAELLAYRHGAVLIGEHTHELRDEYGRQ